MYTLDELDRMLQGEGRVDKYIEPPGKWVPARPLVGPWRWRLRDAWAVLTGRADAFIWPGGQ